MTYLLSLPEDWKIYREEIVNHATDGMASLRSAIDELIEFGYIVYKQERKPNGCFGDCIYQIVEKPICDFPQAVESKVDNQTLLNTNKLNTNKTKSGQTCSNEHLPVPSLQEVYEYYHERQLDVPPDRFWEYNTNRGWVDDKGRKIHNWKKAYENMSPYPEEVYNPSLGYESRFTSDFKRYYEVMNEGD